MTKQELIEKLKECQLDTDTEVAHLEADGLLVDYINDPDITQEYNKIHKWYA